MVLGDSGIIGIVIEEKKSLKEEVVVWITHRKHNIKYITNTNIVHQIVTHAVHFLTGENSSVSLFYLSLSSLELKTQTTKKQHKPQIPQGDTTKTVR